MKGEDKQIQMSETTAVMMALTISGGLQDAYSYFVRGHVFANAQTGNVVLMAQHFFTGSITDGLRYLFPILAFALGVMASEQLRAKLQLEGTFHWRHVVVGIEMVLLVIVGLLPVSEAMNPIANALTSFACAMQVQAFRKVNGYAYASTMCIGNLRSGMEAFSAFLRTREKKLLKQAGQYFLVIFLFFIGAGIGGAVSMCLGQQQYIILIACGLLLISFLMMLRRED